jgi:hypothetical protein
MNDTQRFRDDAAESLLLAKNCQTGYRDLFFLSRPVGIRSLVRTRQSTRCLRAGQTCKFQNLK